MDQLHPGGQPVGGQFDLVVATKVEHGAQAKAGQRLVVTGLVQLAGSNSRPVRTRRPSAVGCPPRRRGS